MTQANTAVIDSMSQKPGRLQKEPLFASWNEHMEYHRDILLEKIVDDAVRALDADGGVLLIAGGDYLQIKTAKGAVNTKMEKLCFARSSSFTGRAVNEGKSINISDTAEDSSYLTELDRKIINRAGSIICVPLSLDGKHTGAMILTKKEKDFFSKENALSLWYFAEQNAIVLRELNIM